MTELWGSASCERQGRDRHWPQFLDEQTETANPFATQPATARSAKLQGGVEACSTEPLDSEPWSTRVETDQWHIRT